MRLKSIALALIAVAFATAAVPQYATAAMGFRLGNGGHGARGVFAGPRRVFAGPRQSGATRGATRMQRNPASTRGSEGRRPHNPGETRRPGGKRYPGDVRNPGDVRRPGGTDTSRWRPRRPGPRPTWERQHPRVPVVAPRPHGPPMQAAPAMTPPPAAIAGPPAGPPPRFVAPAGGERRYVPNEVLVVVRAASSEQALGRMDRDLGLTLLGSHRIGVIDSTVRRYRLRRGMSVTQAVQALQRRGGLVSAAQPNFLFALQGDVAETLPSVVVNPPPAGPPQYAATTLRLAEAHRLATGNGVIVAVIDSGIDETHPAMEGAVAGRFDAVGGSFTPHAHGTAIAGAIAARRTLVSAAPQARLLAIRAFAGGNARGAEGTGLNILRGLDYAVANGANIVNLSFAGPRDALLARALAAARLKGVVGIAAAGNAGPSAAPLYPAAEPGVLAVTATDDRNRLYAQGNRGPYVAVAAPGVDVLVLAPGGAMNMTSGTSIATAEASGVAALLIERNRKASADDLRRILYDTARKIEGEPAADSPRLLDASAAVDALSQ